MKIHQNKMAEIGEIYVFNMRGEKIMADNISANSSKQITLPKGFFEVKVLGKSGSTTRKILVESP